MTAPGRPRAAPACRSANGSTTSSPNEPRRRRGPRRPDISKRTRGTNATREAERAQLTERHRPARSAARRQFSRRSRHRAGANARNDLSGRSARFRAAAITRPAMRRHRIALAAAAAQWASTIDQAVAEISARQSLDVPLVPQLYYAPPPATTRPLTVRRPLCAASRERAAAADATAYAAPAPCQRPLNRFHVRPRRRLLPPRFPAQDLSGLENQLRTITDLDREAASAERQRRDRSAAQGTGRDRRQAQGSDAAARDRGARARNAQHRRAARREPPIRRRSGASSAIWSAGSSTCIRRCAN